MPRFRNEEEERRPTRRNDDRRRVSPRRNPRYDSPPPRRNPRYDFPSPRRNPRSRSPSPRRNPRSNVRNPRSDDRNPRSNPRLENQYGDSRRAWSPYHEKQARDAKPFGQEMGNGSGSESESDEELKGLEFMEFRRLKRQKWRNKLKKCIWNNTPSPVGSDYEISDDGLDSPLKEKEVKKINMNKDVTESESNESESQSDSEDSSRRSRRKKRRSRSSRRKSSSRKKKKYSSSSDDSSENSSKSESDDLSSDLDETSKKKKRKSLRSSRSTKHKKSLKKSKRKTPSSDNSSENESDDSTPKIKIPKTKPSEPEIPSLQLPSSTQIPSSASIPDPEALELKLLLESQKKPPQIPDESEPLVGPTPLPKAEGHISYGGALRPGEGDAIAQYVQQGKRIPRRGEVGLSADEISRFEDLGYVMSGSRHQRMNAIRIRKENQVYSAEDKRALAMFNYEEKAKREGKVMADLQRLVQRHIGEEVVEDVRDPFGGAGGGGNKDGGDE